MTTLEKIRAEIAEFEERIADLPNMADAYAAVRHCLDIIDKYAEQEPTDEWQNGYDRAWEEAKVFYEQEEPTSPCDLCGFNTGEVCGYLGECPAIEKAVSK